MCSGANRDVIVVTPEVDLVARLDPEFVAQFLGNDDLAFGPDAMSHTRQYNQGGDRWLPSPNIPFATAPEHSMCEDLLGSCVDDHVVCQESVDEQGGP
jgi:hypothetical protein